MKVMFKMLTVCGGDSVAIVGKSCQCHIKIWDYLSKYDRWISHIVTQNNRLYVCEDLDNAVYSPVIWKMSTGNSELLSFSTNEEQIVTQKQWSYLQSTCTCVLHVTDCFFYSSAFSHQHQASAQFWDLCRQQQSCNYHFFQFIFSFA